MTEAEAPTIIGAGWVTRTADAGYCGIADGGVYAVPLPADAQRSMAIGDARDARNRRGAEADARDRFEAARIMGVQPKSVGEILALAERKGNAADVIEARHRDAAQAALGDPANALPAPVRPAAPVAEPEPVKRYRELRTDPFMQRMVAEHDQRMTRQAESALRRERIDAQDKISRVTR